VHVDSLVDDYYFYDEKKHYLLGERKGRKFSIGDRVYVQAVRADEALRQVDFRLVENGRPRRRGRRR